MVFNLKTFKKTFSLFLPYMTQEKESRKRCMLAILLILVDVAAGSLVPYFTKHIVDGMNVGLMYSFGFGVAMLCLFWTTEKVIEHVQDILFFPVINLSIRNITADVVEHVHQISLSHYQTLSMPEILSAIKRISLSARYFFKITFVIIIPTCIKMIVAIVIATKLGYFGFTLIPVFLLCLFSLYRGTQWYVAARENAWQTSDQVTMRINDSILNTKLTRPFHDFEMNALQNLLAKEAQFWYQTNTRLHLIYVGIGLIAGMSLCAILYAALSAIQSQALSIGDFVLIKGQLIAAFIPLKKLTIEFRQLAEASVDIAKIIRIFAIPKDTNCFTAPEKDSEKTFQICDLSFAYDTTKPIFNKLNASIFLGEKVAILGENGSGKSTLAAMLAGLQKPNHGTIFLSGRDIQNYSKAEFTRTLHYIPQDLRLFNFSLRENLCYGQDQHVSDLDLKSLLIRVGLQALVESIQEDFNTPLGEMGIRLSGGEKQRVALARALLLQPSILILDETLHSLPIACEDRLLKLIFSEIETVILITHRTTSLALMDRIFKIQNKIMLEIPKTNFKSQKETEKFLTESAEV